jgi:DNA-directed RNA polymerase II subunit RPB2
VQFLILGGIIRLRGEMDGQDDVETLTQPEIWSVIGSFFREKGLVFQQIDSYNLFIQRSIADAVHDHPSLKLQAQNQYAPGHELSDAVC